MNEEITKAIEYLGKAEYVGVLAAKEPRLDGWAASEVLARVLEERGKQVGFLAQPVVELPYLQQPFPRSSTARPLPKEFIISLDTAQTPVSQLRYEKLDDRIDVILSPKASPIREGFISFREGKLLCDSLLVLGIPDIESVATGLNVSPEFFTDTTLINIDTSPSNRRYGEVNLVDPEIASLSEIVYHLVSALPGQRLSAETATALLAGIMEETNNFRNRRTHAATFLAASHLVTGGAEHVRAQELLQQSRPLALLQLFGRVAVRSRIDPEPGILWSFITAEDFEKTRRAPSDVNRVLEHMENTFPPQRLTALLSQDPEEKTILAVLSGAPKLLEKVQLTEPGEFQSLYLRLAARFPSFREAEERISSLLRSIL